MFLAVEGNWTSWRKRERLCVRNLRGPYVHFQSDIDETRRTWSWASGAKKGLKFWNIDWTCDTLQQCNLQVNPGVFQSMQFNWRKLEKQLGKTSHSQSWCYIHPVQPFGTSISRARKPQGLIHLDESKSNLKANLFFFILLGNKYTGENRAISLLSPNLHLSNTKVDVIKSHRPAAAAGYCVMDFLPGSDLFKWFLFWQLYWII